MSATNIFIEILISGIQSLIWLCILAATCLDLSKLSTRIAGPTIIEVLTGSAFILAISYLLGVLFDRLWDWALERLSPGLKDRAKEQATKRMHSQRDEFDRIRSEVYRASSEKTVAFIEFSRSRLRVARSSIFNIPLITITSFFWVLIRYDSNKLQLIGFIIVVGAMLSLLAVYAYMRLRIVYYQNLLMVDKLRYTDENNDPRKT